jgi:hypothetical protein
MLFQKEMREKLKEEMGCDDAREKEEKGEVVI